MAIMIYAGKVLNKNINQLELQVEFSAYGKTDRTWNAVNSTVRFNRLYIPEEGSGIITCGSETVTMVPGMAYLIPAGLSVSYHCPDRMTKYFFHLNLLKPDQYDLFLEMKQIGQLPFSQEQLRLLQATYHSGSYADVLSVKLQLYQILLRFQSAYGLAQQPIPDYSPYVISAIAYIRQNLSAQLQAKEVAKQCYVSASFLSRQFRREIGVSLGQYIDDQLLAEAQRRLEHSEASIGEISRSLGFSDQCYFSRRFKQICGCTPTKYRSLHRSS